MKMQSETNVETRQATFRPAMPIAVLRRLYAYVGANGIPITHFVREAVVEKLEREESQGND